MVIAFLLRFQESLRDAPTEQLIQSPSQTELANITLTVTEVEGEQPRRDPKKLSCGVFSNQSEE
jgi:hypothetical protein